MASGARGMSGRSVGDLDKVGFDFDGGGDEAGEFDDEAAFAHPSDRQQASVVAVEHAADDAYPFAAHGVGDFAGAVEGGGGGGFDGEDEAFHFAVAHGHGLVGCTALDVAVLQRGGCLNVWVKGRFGFMNE